MDDHPAYMLLHLQEQFAKARLKKNFRKTWEVLFSVRSVLCKCIQDLPTYNYMADVVALRYIPSLSILTSNSKLQFGLLQAPPCVMEALQHCNAAYNHRGIRFVSHAQLEFSDTKMLPQLSSYVSRRLFREQFEISLQGLLLHDCSDLCSEKNYCDVINAATSATYDGILLLEVQTEHEGGGITFLRHFDEDFQFDMKTPNNHYNNRAICAFRKGKAYTVAPVTSGTRVLLVYHINIKHNEQKEQQNDAMDEEEIEEEEEGDETNSDVSDMYEMTAETFFLNGKYDLVLANVCEPTTPKFNNLIDILSVKVTDKTNIALPLFYRYRQRDLHHKHLHPFDRCVCDAISEVFTVQLVPVLINVTTHDGIIEPDYTFALPAYANDTCTLTIVPDKQCTNRSSNSATTEALPFSPSLITGTTTSLSAVAMDYVKQTILIIVPNTRAMTLYYTHQEDHGTSGEDIQYFVHALLVSKR